MRISTPPRAPCKNKCHPVESSSVAERATWKTVAGDFGFCEVSFEFLFACCLVFSFPALLGLWVRPLDSLTVPVKFSTCFLSLDSPCSDLISFALLYLIC